MPRLRGDDDCEAVTDYACDNTNPLVRCNRECVTSPGWHFGDVMSPLELWAIQFALDGIKRFLSARLYELLAWLWDRLWPKPKKPKLDIWVM